MKFRSHHLMAIGVALVLGAPIAAKAESIAFSADLKASSEVPPNDSPGTGTVEATFDTETKAFAWTIEYSDLTGDATAAHFHGPAGPEENAGPVVPIEGSLASPIEGEATLTDDQAAQLQDGMWYFNLHTAEYPDGEIRGQVTKQ
jgi:hypothetical protein